MAHSNTVVIPLEVLFLSGRRFKVWVSRAATVLAVKLQVQVFAGVGAERLALFSELVEIHDEELIGDVLSFDDLTVVTCVSRDSPHGQPTWRSCYSEDHGCLLFRNEETGELKQTLSTSEAPDVIHIFLTAARDGDYHLVNLLLAAMPADTSNAALLSAALHGHFAVLGALLQPARIADARCCSEALHVACAMGSADLMRKLLVHRGDPQWQFGATGSTALHAAAFFGHPQGIDEILLACGRN